MGGGITLKPGLPTLIYEQKEPCSSIGQLVLGNPHKSMISSTMTLYKQVKSKIRFKKRRATGTNTGKTEVKSVIFQNRSVPMTSHSKAWPFLLPRASWRAPKALLGKSLASQQMPFGIDLRGFLFSAVMGCQTGH